MSKFKKKLRRAAKIGIGLGVAMAAKKAMFDQGADLVSGKDSEVGAIAATKKAPVRIAKLGESDSIDKVTKSPTFPKLEERKKFRSVRPGKGTKSKMLTAADIRARNKAGDIRRATAAKGKERYSLLGSMGFAKGQMITAKGGKEIVGKKTKIF